MTDSPQARYIAIITHFADDPTVAPSTRGGFTRDSLLRNGKLLVALRGEMLMMKLPAPRVAELIAAGQGAPFDANKGKPMKEWVLANMSTDWLALAKEAAAFVG
jgi:hypothetical protein